MKDRDTTKKRKTSKPRKMSIMLGLVPVGRPKGDRVRKDAEELRPVIAKPRD